MSWKGPGKRLTWADIPVPGNQDLTSPVNKKTLSPTEGIDDILRVTQELEKHNISYCLVGVSALIFYGASRIRSDWEICVPTDLIEDATKLLQSHRYSDDWRLVDPWQYYDQSLVWSYHRFEGAREIYHFVLVPLRDVHLDLDPANLTRSLRGLPYPKLDVFIQSTLEMHNMLQLIDVVDGTDVSEEWGEENLDLEGETDTQWAEDMNKRGKELAHGRWGSGASFAHDMPRSKRKMWQEAARTKEKRLDWTKPKDIFVTQYRIRDEPEPWTVLSNRY